MTRINIDHLTESELIDLNHRVVERLRLIRQLHAHKAMLEFRIGDRVVFQGEAGSVITGVLTRYNKKSVTVLTGDGQRWNVSPQLLRPAEPIGQTGNTDERAPSNEVIPFRKK
jgi:hypothetical protein